MKIYDYDVPPPAWFLAGQVLKFFRKKSIIFSSANTVSSINFILNIPGCLLHEGR